ncbi:MAG: hypothetical protein ACKOPC_12445 [Methylocystis sp.]
MLHLHPETFLDVSARNAPIEERSSADASAAFVIAMDNLIDGLKETEAKFLAKAAERSERLRVNMIVSHSD